MDRQIGVEFMELSKYKHLPVSDQNQGLPQPPLEKLWAAERQVIALPEPAGAKVRPVDVTEAINRRCSVRSYSAEPLSLEELSYLLWCTQGVKEIAHGSATLRTVPSAGARHPFETYVLANRVSGLQPGIYVYLASKNQLREHLIGPGVGERAARAAFRQRFVATSAVTFIWSAVAYRSVWRYGQRAYRYMHLDAGHVCAHLYLAVQGLGGGCCAIAAFDDDEINSLLGLDGQEEFVIYLATAGKLPAG